MFKFADYLSECLYICGLLPSNLLTCLVILLNFSKMLYTPLGVTYFENKAPNVKIVKIPRRTIYLYVTVSWSNSSRNDVYIEQYRNKNCIIYYILLICTPVKCCNTTFGYEKLYVQNWCSKWSKNKSNETVWQCFDSLSRIKPV